MPSNRFDGTETNKNTFSSTNQPANRGRKKKAYTLWKEQGYTFSKQEIRESYAVLLSLTPVQLEELLAHPEVSNLEKLVAGVLQKAIKTKNFSRAKDIIEMISDKPTQRTEEVKKLELNIPLIAWVTAAGSEQQAPTIDINHTEIVQEKQAIAVTEEKKPKERKVKKKRSEMTPQERAIADNGKPVKLSRRTLMESNKRAKQGKKGKNNVTE